MDNKRKRYTPKIFSEKVNELIVLLCSREGSPGGDAITSLYETLKKAPRGSLDQYGFLLQEGQPQTSDEVLYVKQKLSGATVLPSLAFKYSNDEREITGFLLYDHSQGKGRKVKIKSGGLNSPSLKINVGMGFFTSSYDLTFIIFGKEKTFGGLRQLADENDITTSTNIDTLKVIKQGEKEAHINTLDNPTIVKNDNIKSRTEGYDKTHPVSEQEKTGISEENAIAEVHSVPNIGKITHHEEISVNAGELIGTTENEDGQATASIEEANIIVADTKFTEENANLAEDDDEQISAHAVNSTSTADDNKNTEAMENISKDDDKKVLTPVGGPNLFGNDSENKQADAILPKDEDKYATTSLGEPSLALDDHTNIEVVQKLSEDEDKKVSAAIDESALTAENIPKDEDKKVFEPVEKSTVTADGETNEVKEDTNKAKIDKVPLSNKNKKAFLNISYL